MSTIFKPERWVLIRVVGPRVAENFKLLAGWTEPNHRGELWTFTTAVVSAKHVEGVFEVCTNSDTYHLTPERTCYAFNVKTAEIFVKMHRIAASNGMTFHVVDEHKVVETLKRYWNGDADTALPDELS